MIRKVVPLLLVVTIAGLIGLLTLTAVVAQAGASRELPADPVSQDEKFMVTITDTGYGADKAIGQVEETLPAGFSYVPGSATKVVGHATKGTVRGTVDPADIRMVAFTVVSVDSFTYEVMVGSDVRDGEHTFSGAAGGDAAVTVETGAMPVPSPDPSPEPSPEPTPGGVSRELPADPVAGGERFTVTITDTGYGADKAIGQVEETLPAGFSYVHGSATKVVGHATKGTVRGTVDPADIRMVAFTVVSVDSFTYEVMVGADVRDGEHTFAGAGGDATITVEGGTTTPGGASRELPADPVSQGEKFMVTITDTGYGADKAIGQIEETVPAGFSYVPGSATKVVGHATKGAVRGTVDAADSRMVAFTVVSVDSFTYEVMVGADVRDGEHTFSGAGGQSSVTVEPTPEPTPTRRPSTGGGGGSTGGVPVVAPPVQPTPTPAPTAEPTGPVPTPVLGQRPSQPHVFTGDVMVGEGMAMEGTEVSAMIDGETVAMSMVMADGTYTLKIDSGDADYSGKMVMFMVGMENVEQSAEWMEGMVSPLNLMVMEPEPTEPPAGMPGPTGMPGPAGQAGADGADGQDGRQGRQGPQGRGGADGNDGADGADGRNGSDARNGSDGNDGADGALGAKGDKGDGGDMGDMGDQGTAGATGGAGAGGGVGIVGIIALIIGIVALVAAGGTVVLNRRG